MLLEEWGYPSGRGGRRNRICVEVDTEPLGLGKRVELESLVPWPAAGGIEEQSQWCWCLGKHWWDLLASWLGSSHRYLEVP